VLFCYKMHELASAMEKQTTYNMGVRKHSPSCSFDWIALSFPDVIGVRDHLLNLLANNNKWVEAPGFYGYKRCLQYGHYRVYDQGNHSIFLELRGEGCRQLATEKHLRDEDGWIEWFNMLTEFGGRATRVDISVDDKRGLVNISTIVRKVLKDHFTSTFRESKTYTVSNRETGKHRRSGVVFGSSKSERKLLIYDKAFEANQTGDWIRIELQTRDNTARALILNFCKHGFDAVTNDIRARLNFLVPRRDTANAAISTWTTCRWWDRLVGINQCRFKALVDVKRAWISDDQLRQFRAHFVRILDKEGIEGLECLFSRCACLLDDDLKRAITAYTPASIGGKWMRRIRLAQASDYAKDVDMRRRIS